MDSEFFYAYSENEIWGLVSMLSLSFLFAGVIYHIFNFFEKEEEESYYSIVFQSKSENNENLTLFSNGAKNVVLFGNVKEFLHKNGFYVHNLSDYLVDKILEFAVSRYIENNKNNASHFISCYMRPISKEQSDTDDESDEEIVDLTNALRILQGPSGDFLIGMNTCWTLEMFAECLNKGIGSLNQEDVDLEYYEIVVMDNNCNENVWKPGQCISELLPLKKSQAAE